MPPQCAVGPPNPGSATDSALTAPVEVLNKKGAEGLTAAQLKDRGNKEFKEARYEEAKHSYTEALRLDPYNHVLWCNRSAANLKLALAHFAAADALECIRVNASFLKGHLRLAEVRPSQQGRRGKTQITQNTSCP
jgi:tetratricopeptide (TPR) repeat protein